MEQRSYKLFTRSLVWNVYSIGALATRRSRRLGTIQRPMNLCSVKCHFEHSVLNCIWHSLYHMH